MTSASAALGADLGAVELLTPWPASDYEWGDPERGCEEVIEVEMAGERHPYGARLWDEVGRTVLEAWDEDLDGEADRWMRRRWDGDQLILVSDRTHERTWVYSYAYDELGNLTYSGLDQGPTGRPNAEWHQDWDGDRLIWRGFDYPVGGDLEEERFQTWSEDSVHIAYHNHLWTSDNYTEVRTLDSEGRWTSGVLDSGANGIVDWEIAWEWAADGELAREVWSSSWEVMTQESSWSWGPHGLEGSETIMMRSDTVVSHRTEAIEYDAWGRVVARTIADTDPAVPDHRLLSHWLCAVDPS